MNRGFSYIRRIANGESIEDPAQIARDAAVIASRLPDEPTLHDQLEDMLITVWRCEREWKLDDRINLLAELAR